jgi:hypothetical protein
MAAICTLTTTQPPAARIYGAAAAIPHPTPLPPGKIKPAREINPTAQNLAYDALIPVWEARGAHRAKRNRNAV